MKTNSTPRRGRVAACLLPGLWLLVGAGPAAAQGWLGLAQSNYGGTNSAYLNPGASAGSRLRAHLNLGGADASFYNTYLQLNLPRKPWEAGFAFRQEYLVEQGGSRGPQYASATAEVRLPALMLALGPCAAVAFSSRVRGFAQANGVSYRLAQLARYGLGLANQLLTDNSCSLEASAYHEFALTYARTFTPNTTHFFKGSLRLKYLVGLGGGGVRNEGGQFKVLNKNTTELQNCQLSYDLTDYQLHGQDGFTVGSRYGADPGLTYEWRPTNQQYTYHMAGRAPTAAARPACWPPRHASNPIGPSWRCRWPRPMATGSGSWGRWCWAPTTWAGAGCWACAQPPGPTCISGWPWPCAATTAPPATA